MPVAQARLGQVPVPVLVLVLGQVLEQVLVPVLEQVLVPVPWTAQTNTLIVNNLANGEQFWWRYADDEAATDPSISKKMEGAGIKPNVGAGKASDTDSLMAVDA